MRCFRNLPISDSSQEMEEVDYGTPEFREEFEDYNWDEERTIIYSTLRSKKNIEKLFHWFNIHGSVY